MNDQAVKDLIAKLEIIKELASEKSVQQICDTLIQYFKGCNKGGSFGFGAEKKT